MSWIILDPDLFHHLYKEKTVNDSKAWDLGSSYAPKQDKATDYSHLKDSIKKGLDTAVPDLNSVLSASLKAAGWTPPPTAAEREHRKALVRQLATALGVRVEVK